MSISLPIACVAGFIYCVFGILVLRTIRLCAGPPSRETFYLLAGVVIFADFLTFILSFSYFSRNL